MSLEYGVIGNGRTVALISQDASIDWLCMPRFDAPSIFGRLLDQKKGGSFQIVPKRKCTVKQAYVKNTNVLKTTLIDGHNELDIYDYFPYYEEKGEFKRGSEIHRVIVPRKGRMSLSFRIDPVFDYASKHPKAEVERGVLSYNTGYESLSVYSNLDLNKIKEGKFVTIGKESYITIAYNFLKPSTSLAEIKTELDKTVKYWKKWSSKVRAPRAFRDPVIRSSLVLRLLTYDDSGAIVAAPTTSLPEIVGNVRNWDYRYCWIRDASFTVLALLSIGKTDVAHEFIKWLNTIYSESGSLQQAVFGINHEHELREHTLDYLAGYEGSRPVRVGNAAYLQRQIDIFGELLDAIHFFYIDYRIKKLDKEQWDIVYTSAESAINSWKFKDSSIWEFRGIQRHFTFSKVLCWVAVDRAIRIAKHFKKTRMIKRWTRIAKEIKADVMKNGWNKELHSFVQHYGSKELDASLLLMPFFGFIRYKDPKMVSTINAMKDNLFVKGFMKRYSSADDFGKPENAMIVCTFWLIEALYATGKRSEARHLFDNMIEHSNHLGLLSEDINPDTGELLGNFPQAYSHIALINTAMTLSRARRRIL